LKQNDIEILEFDVGALRRKLINLLGLQETSLGPTGNVIPVGNLGLRAGLSIPVFIALPTAYDPITPAMLPRPSTGESSPIVLVPDRRFIEAGEASLLLLSELIGADPGQSLTILDAGTVLLDQIKALSSAPHQSKEIAWSLPVDTRWEDLTLELTADEVLNVWLEAQHRRFEPHQLGMTSAKNGRPTSAWTFLCAIIEHRGRLPSRGGSSVHKQKQTLSQVLREKFGISDDPVSANRREGAYDAKFRTIDNRTINAPARIKSDEISSNHFASRTKKVRS
jgi:hypothetical protein